LRYRARDQLRGLGPTIVAARVEVRRAASRRLQRRADQYSRTVGDEACAEAVTGRGIRTRQPCRLRPCTAATREHVHSTGLAGTGRADHRDVTGQRERTTQAVARRTVRRTDRSRPLPCAAPRFVDVDRTL